MRLRVSAVYPCHCSGIWCSAWAVVSCRVTVAWIFVAGALRWLLRERLNASQPQGAATSEPPHRPLCSDLPGAHAERSPRPLVLSPFGFCGSRRQRVVNPRTRVSGALAVEDNQPSRRLVLLEPETTAGNQPRVHKSPSSPRPLQSNQLPCLQKLLEPETAAGNQPRVFKSSCNSKNWNTWGQPVPQ